MQREHASLIISNPHRGEIYRDLLAQVLREAGIAREEWEPL